MKGMNGWTANKASEKSGISEIELYKKLQERPLTHFSLDREGLPSGQELL